MRRGGFVDFGVLRYRDAQRQNRARAIAPIMRLDAATLRLDKTAANRQTEPGAGAAPVLRLHAIEFVEDAFEIVRRDARSLIDYFDRDGVSVLPGCEIDAAAGRRVFGGVVEQV